MWNNIQAASKSSRNFVLQRSPVHNDYSSGLQGHTWPSGEDFYHPLNPMFGYFLKTDEHLKFYKIILLRDGAQGLLDFFCRFPMPKKGYPTLLVNKDLLFLVPLDWRPVIYAYSIETPRKFEMTNKFMFYGLVSNAALSWPVFKPRIEKWLSQFDKSAEVSAFFSLRSEIFDTDSREKTIVYELTSYFQLHFKRKINFLTFDDVKSLTVDKELTFVNLDLWLSGIGTCNVESMMMGRSPQVFPRGTYPGFKGQKIGEWPLSFHHHINVYHNVKSQHDDFPFLYDLFKMGCEGLDWIPKLPEPMKPMLWDLLTSRMEVKGLS